MKKNIILLVISALVLLSFSGCSMATSGPTDARMVLDGNGTAQTVTSEGLFSETMSKYRTLSSTGTGADGFQRTLIRDSGFSDAESIVRLMLLTTCDDPSQLGQSHARSLQDGVHSQKEEILLKLTDTSSLPSTQLYVIFTII